MANGELIMQLDLTEDGSTMSDDNNNSLSCLLSHSTTPSTLLHAIKTLTATDAVEVLKKGVEEAGGADKLALILHSSPSCASATLLHWAADRGSEFIMNYICNRPFQEIDAVDDAGATALHWAAGEGHVKCVQLLIQHKAEVNKQDSLKETPLHWASMNGKAECVTVLLEMGGRVNMVAEKSQQSALHLASLNGHTDVVSLLIDRGADLTLTDSSNKTARSYAEELKHEDIIPLFDPKTRKSYLELERLRKENKEIIYKLHRTLEERQDYKQKWQEEINKNTSNVSSLPQFQQLQKKVDSLQTENKLLYERLESANQRVIEAQESKEAIHRDLIAVKCEQNEAEAQKQVALKQVHLLRSELAQYKSQINAGIAEKVEQHETNKSNVSSDNHFKNEYEIDALRQLKSTLANLQMLLAMTNGSVQDTTVQLGTILKSVNEAPATTTNADSKNESDDMQQ